MKYSKFASFFFSVVFGTVAVEGNSQRVFYWVQKLRDERNRNPNAKQKQRNNQNKGQCGAKDLALVCCLYKRQSTQTTNPSIHEQT